MRIKSFSCLCLISFLFACSVRSPLSGYFEPKSAAGEEPLQAVVNAKLEYRPLAHPDPADHQDYQPKYSNPNEIPLTDFLMHKAHPGRINALAVTKDGLKAYSGGQDGKVVCSTIIKSVQKKDQADDRPLNSFIKTQVLAESGKPILGLSLSPDENLLLVSMFSGVALLDLEKQLVVGQQTRIKGRIQTMAWDPRGEFISFGRTNGDIFIWNLKNLKDKIADTTETLERYETSSSPIVGLAFHPSGRAFFSVERNGSVYVWRDLRTERELGLRDDDAVEDRSFRGSQRTRIGVTSGNAESLWLNHDASELYVSSSDGYVYRWKVRGLKSLPKIAVGADSVAGVQGVTLGRRDLNGEIQKIPLLVTVGRSQRLRFWCQNVAGEESDSLFTGAQVVAATAAEPLTQSSVFLHPLMMLQIGSDSPYLWAAQKTGNVVTFNVNFLLESPSWRARIEQCRE